MKKAKELLLFLAVLVIPLVLFILVSVLTADVISDKPNFVGFDNYIRLFLNDKMFWKALLNTILPTAMVSFLSVSVFAFIFGKKIKVPRWVFYLGSVIIGGLSTLIYTSYLGIMFSLTISNLYAAYLADAEAITSNVCFSLYVGIFTAFLFWILESIVDIIKKFRRKRDW